LVRRVARARLGSQVIRRLRQAGVGDARYDATAFTVRFTADGDDVPTVLPLDGLLARRSGSRRERRAQVDSFVSGFLRTPGLPGTWAEVRPLLRPVLRGATPAPTAEVSTPLCRPALPYLAEYVVVDQPDTMTYVAGDQLTVWGVDADAVFAAARANLSGAVLQGVATEPVVVQFVDDGNSYWTSHLLLPGWLARLADQVGGVPVAFAPERGTLIVAADGSAHLGAVFGRCEQAFETSPRALTPMAYVSDEQGRTVPYAAPSGHPLHGCVQRAEAVLAVAEYSRQARVLGDDAAPLQVIGSERDGWRTRAVWVRDAPTWLPLADEVRMGERIVPWAELRGVLAPVPELNPPRWGAANWPDAG
jgi:hypothetical protein